MDADMARLKERRQQDRLDKKVEKCIEKGREGSRTKTTGGIKK